MIDDDLVPMLEIRAKQFSDLHEIWESGTDIIKEQSYALAKTILSELIGQLQAFEDNQESSQ